MKKNIVRMKVIRTGEVLSGYIHNDKFTVENGAEETLSYKTYEMGEVTVAALPKNDKDEYESLYYQGMFEAADAAMRYRVQRESHPEVCGLSENDSACKNCVGCFCNESVEG